MAYSIMEKVCFGISLKYSSVESLRILGKHMTILKHRIFSRGFLRNGIVRLRIKIITLPC
jgi:hypothetical protein